MSMVRRPRMTADEFIAWAMEQPETEHYELIDGEIVAMAPERLSHVRMKGRIFRRLAGAIEAAGLPCEALPDGMAVQVDETTAYEPDAQVRCGPSLDPDAVKIFDPMIVVDVLSPSTQGVDSGNKLVDYFRVPSIRHYLIVRASDGRTIHHWRGADGEINTRIHAGGPITLDPPGIEFDLTP
jgi:Uma2 family endonuclease